VVVAENFREEGFQVLADDSVKGRVFGVAGLIRAVGMRHAHR